MLTSLDMLQLLLASAVIAWASHVLWKNGGSLKSPVKVIVSPAHRSSLASARTEARCKTSEKSEDEPELTQLPSRQRKKAQEDHV